MKLREEGLRDRESWERIGVRLPSYDIASVRRKSIAAPRWVHFGIGNIFRIFIGGIADTLLNEGELDRGISCAESFDFDLVDRIYRPHDNLLLSVTLNPDGSLEKRVIASLAEAVKAEGGGWERLREIFRSRELQIASLTITEKGYALRGADGSFLPFVREDLERGPEKPLSVMAILTALLYERFRSAAGPIALVSMDNCSKNGEKLRSSILTVAEEWRQRGFLPEDFLHYLEEESEVSFPWTMIDKITPRPAEAVAEKLSELGIEDMEILVTGKGTYIAPFVNAEGPQYLVIEDRFPNGRPPLEKAGVYMTDRDTVNRVERMKVTTCLNPLHTALAVYGCLLGYRRISDEMKDRELRALVERIGETEGLPVVTDPGILSPRAFLSELLSIRIPNPYMPDTPQRIATDSSQKVGIRYGETIKAYASRYKSADRLLGIPLAIAGWLRYLLAVDDEGRSFERSPDPMLQSLTEALSGIRLGEPDSAADRLRPILANENIFGIDLYRAGIGEKIEGYFREELRGRGAVRATLKKYLSGEEDKKS